MAKRHYIPITADVEGVDSDRTRALIRKAIRTALAAEGVTVPCEVDVLLTNTRASIRSTSICARWTAPRTC